MLQQNWALIEPVKVPGVRVHFITDTSGVFDVLDFASEDDAQDGLIRNGFQRLAEDARLQSFLRSPTPPFHQSDHPNGPIYSSGRFWRS